MGGSEAHSVRLDVCKSVWMFYQKVSLLHGVGGSLFCALVTVVNSVLLVAFSSGGVL